MGEARDNPTSPLTERCGMRDGMFIGELSRQAGVPTQTIRYYERFGLMDQPDRTESRYRLYSWEDVERLRFIQKAKLFGLSLDEIKELIAIRAEGNPPCKHLKQLVQHHIDDLDRRIREMTAFRDELARRYERIQVPGPCDGRICRFIEQESLTET